MRRLRQILVTAALTSLITAGTLLSGTPAWARHVTKWYQTISPSNHAALVRYHRTPFALRQQIHHSENSRSLPPPAFNSRRILHNVPCRQTIHFREPNRHCHP